MTLLLNDVVELNCTRTILVASDQRLLGEVLADALDREPDWRVYRPCVLPSETVDVCRRLRPDLLLVSVMSCESLRFEDIRVLVKDLGVKVMTVTPEKDAAAMASLVREGAAGCLSADSSLDEVRNAVRPVLSGGLVLSPGWLTEVVADLTSLPDARQRPRRLTDREQAVLDLMSAGKSTRDIADELDISFNTARTHVQRILVKMDVHSQVEATAVAARMRASRV